MVKGGGIAQACSGNAHGNCTCVQTVACSEKGHSIRRILCRLPCSHWFQCHVPTRNVGSQTMKAGG